MAGSGEESLTFHGHCEDNTVFMHIFGIQIPIMKYTMILLDHLSFNLIPLTPFNKEKSSLICPTPFNMVYKCLFHQT